MRAKLPGIIIALFAFTVFLLAIQQTRADETVKVEAVPDWVAPLDIPQVNPKRVDQVQRGIYSLLDDTEIRITPGGYDYFARTAYQVTDREGLESGASIQEPFDPATATLAFNFLRIIRDGKPIDALVPKDILVLRREQRMERGVFDGAMTAHIEMRGLRVGDIVEYGVTWHERTPLWPNDFFGGTETDWSVPLGVQRYRLIWPKDRPLAIRATDPAITPTITESGPSKIYEWRITDPEPKPSEDNLPYGFDVYNMVRISTMADWPTVSRWAFGLYDKPNPLPPETEAEVAAIAKANADPADRITEAVRLVEDNIRYVSISIAAGSYIPRPAATIVHDGFGDCKDKSTLLVAILRKLGVEAYPALANTNEGPGLPARLPSTRAFDHMIVLIKYQGRNYWIDPTLSHQGGRFPHIWYPDHGNALPIVEGGSDLLPVVYPKGAGDTVSATEHFVLDPKTSTFRLTADTIYSEDEADMVRERLAEKGRDKFAKEYLDYYKKNYPDLVADSAPVIRDDRDLNQISVSERYTLANGIEEYGKYTPYLPSSVRGLFNDLPGNRLYPYGLNPEIRRHNTVVLEAPGIDAVRVKDIEIDNPQFKFTKRVARHPNELSMAYDIRIRDPQVPLADFPKFRAAVQELDDATWESISLKIAEANSHQRGTAGHAARAVGIGIFFLAHVAVTLLLIGFGARYGLQADRAYAKQAVYYPVGLRKFLVMNLFTGGIYGSFWLWKCWRWIKQRDERDIWPFWRAVFAIVWWDALFQNIRNRDPALASPRWIGLASWALYAGVVIVDIVWARHHPAAQLLVELVGIFCLAPTVRAVNRLNAADAIILHRNSRFNGWNIAGIIVGALFIAIAILQIADPGWINAAVMAPG